MGVEHVEAHVSTMAELSDSPHLTLLVGAGASAGAGLADWTTLVTQLLVTCAVVPDVPTALALAASQGAELTSEAALCKISDSDVRAALVAEALYGTDDPSVATARYTAGSVHVAVADLAAVRTPSSCTLMTLNFDDLLEEALVQAELRGVGVEVFARDASAPRGAPGMHVVHHLHGLLSRDGSRRSTELVLTLSDYHRVLADNQAWQRTELAVCRQRGPVLLVGTSYSDANIRLWTAELSKDPALGKVYVLLPRQGLGLSTDAFDALRPTLTSQWESLGVTVLYVDSYGDLAQVIREMHVAALPDYVSSAARVASVWSATIADFIAHQQADAAELDADRAALRPDLGDDTNLTLWLADGTGRLVRWAAHDRIHRSAELLRAIVAVPESPWVAAQALCADEEVVRLAMRAESEPATETRRWHSVVARPVRVKLGTHPAVAVGVLSSATSWPVESDGTVDRWSDALEAVADRWAARLRDRVDASR